ncbi:MAG: mechanosensitive ion channel family protein [Phycisphaerales bacterium]
MFRTHRFAGRLIGALALTATFMLAPAPAVAQDAPAITSTNEALAALNSTDTSEAVLTEAVKPLTKAELEEASAIWLENAKTAVATGEGRADAIAKLKLIAETIEAKGGDPADLKGELAYWEGDAAGDVDLTNASGLAKKFNEWLVSPDGGIKLGLNIALFIVVLIVARIVAGIVSNLVRRTLNRLGKGSELLRSFLANITRQVIFFIGVIVAIGRLGIDTGPVLAAIGAAGFVIGFALQGTLGNFAAGVMILLYQPYDIGNVVTVGGVTGKVQAMTLVSTTLLTPDNQTIIVPNGAIWGDTITNVTGNDTRRVDLVFGCGYDDDVEKAESLLKEILEGHPLVLKDPAPAVAMGELADSSVNFNVRPWCKTEDYWTVFSDIKKTVKKRFDDAGLGIPFPQMDVHLHKTGD